jgi:hypothetical protein
MCLRKSVPRLLSKAGFQLKFPRFHENESTLKNRTENTNEPILATNITVLFQPISFTVSIFHHHLFKKQ